MRESAAGGKIGLCSQSLKSFVLPLRGGALLLAAAAFAAGLTAGALIAPVAAGRGDAVAAIETRQPQPASALRSGHPAEVVRVIDGDTFEARVRIWPGMDVTTASACAASTRRNCARVATTSG